MVGQYLWTPVVTGAGTATFTFAQDDGYDYTICGAIGTASVIGAGSFTMSNIIECNMTTFNRQTGLFSFRNPIPTTGMIALEIAPNAGWKFQFVGENNPACVCEFIVAAATVTLRIAFWRMRRATTQ